MNINRKGRNGRNAKGAMCSFDKQKEIKAFATTSRPLRFFLCDLSG